MVFKLAFQGKQCQELCRIDPAEEVEHTAIQAELDDAEIRRQMYERIARGNALAEIEEQANRVR